jgi:hypothetical protein
MCAQSACHLSPSLLCSNAAASTARNFPKKSLGQKPQSIISQCANIDYWLLTTEAINRRVCYWPLAVIGYWLLVIGYWLLAIVWLLAIGYWLLAIGYWLLALLPLLVVYRPALSARRHLHGGICTAASAQRHLHGGICTAASAPVDANKGP